MGGSRTPSILSINPQSTQLQVDKETIKAMLVNWIGDFGSSLGILGHFTLFQIVDSQTLSPHASAFSKPQNYFIFYNIIFHSIIVICISPSSCNVGKSTQIGLHTRSPNVIKQSTMNIQPMNMSALLKCDENTSGHPCKMRGDNMDCGTKIKYLGGCYTSSSI